MNKFYIFLIFSVLCFTSAFAAIDIQENKKYRHDNFSKKNFTSTPIKNVRFEHSRFKRTNFEKTSIENSYFHESDLSFANLKGTNISKTKFVNCNLEYADFTDAIISDDTQFINCNLFETTGLSEEQKRHSQRK